MQDPPYNGMCLTWLKVPDPLLKFWYRTGQFNSKKLHFTLLLQSQAIPQITTKLGRFTAMSKRHIMQKGDLKINDLGTCNWAAGT